MIGIGLLFELDLGAISVHFPHVKRVVLLFVVFSNCSFSPSFAHRC
jgi:hypothetical protein